MKNLEVVTVSQLISTLEKLRNSHGDLGVLVRNYSKGALRSNTMPLLRPDLEEISIEIAALTQENPVEYIVI
jgi:hypothetical protein